MYKDLQLAVLINPSENDAVGILPFALGMANAVGASLDVAAVGLLVDPVEPLELEAVDRANRATRERAHAWVEHAVKEADASGVHCVAQVISGSEMWLSWMLRERGKRHDVNLIAAAKDSVVGRSLLHGLLSGTGRPLIVVPSCIKTFSAQRILVAWDGSIPAARAAHDALPLLVAADQVSLVTVVGEKEISDALSGSEFAPHLARHGAKAEARPLNLNKDVAVTLRNHAAVMQADMMVMGAWGHSRIREFIFGGVTRTMLGECDLPLFMTT